MVAVSDKWMVLVVCFISVINTWFPGLTGALEIRDNENEVIKERPVPLVPLDVLEAYYYRTYAEYENMGAVGGRRGRSTKTNSCTDIRDVPKDLRSPRFMRPRGLSPVYQKYTEAYGIPVLGSSKVADAALSRACYVLRFLLADRADLREGYYKAYGRVAVIHHQDAISSIPEYYFLPDTYDVATRGLGAIGLAPVSSSGQENLLCYHNDSRRTEDIMLREIAHGIHHLAAKYIVPDFQMRLTDLFTRAIQSQWWANSYARHTPDAYFGEGVQSFYNVNAYASPPNGYDNEINTRNKLRAYDTQLYMLVHNLFPCANKYIKRCNTRHHEHYQNLKMDCHPMPWRNK